MKKHGKALIGLIAVCAIVLGMGAFFLKNVSFQQKIQEKQEEKLIAEDAAADTTGIINELIAKSNKAKFTILEIVPDLSVAELGYMDPGQEPQDWIGLCQQGKAEGILEKLDISYDKDKKWVINEAKYNEYKAKYGTEDWWEGTWTETTSSDGEIVYQCKYPYLENEGNGDDFEELVRIIDNGSNKIAILAVTTEQLNNGSDATQTLLEDTDMIYIHQNSEYSFSANDNKLDLSWSVARKIFKEVAIREDSNENFDPMVIFFGKSLYTDAIEAGKSVSPVQYQLDRDNQKLVKTDYATKTAKASNNNICKLYIMSMFRDTTEFYNLFLTSVEANGDAPYIESGSFSIQSGDAKDYWNMYTFLPTKDQEDGYAKADAAYWESIRISLDSERSSNGSAYAADVSSTPLLKKWSSVTNELGDAMAYEPKEKITKKSYKVLDIEPAKYSDTNGKKTALEESIAKKIIKLSPYQEYKAIDDIKVSVETMTTAEFIGRQDDIISTYDFVYIGACTDSLWMDKSNDSSMKNIIYAHVGGKVQMMGTSGNEYSKIGYALSPTDTTFYYSGNDITNIKKIELENFIKTGYPIVISSDLLNSGGTKADDNKFNDRSNNNMYAFINEVMDEKQVLPEDFDYRTKTSEEANKILHGLNMKKPTLNITSYMNGSSDGATITNNGSLSISFNVKDSYDTDSKRTYYVGKLYIDKNADGLYKSSEIFATSGVFRGNGTTVTLKRSLNSNYCGALSWKLEVTKQSSSGTDTYVKVGKTGYNTVRNTMVAKRTVKVLQIVSDGYTGIGDKKFYGSTNWAGEYSLTLDLTGSFQDYANDKLEDYQLDINKIRVKEFCESSNYTDPDKLESTYDILIFGFADSYIDFNMTEKAAYSIQKFIDDGHSVMFTHDLTFATNTENFYSNKPQDMAESAYVGLERHTGFYFTQYFRDTMGMNRFGIDPISPSRNRDSSLKTSVTAAVRNRISVGKSNGIYDKTSLGTNGFTYSALMQYANMPRNGTASRGTPYIGPYKNLSNDNYSYMNTYSNNGNFKNVAGTGYETDSVSQVNEGQITKYPIDLTAKYGSTTNQQVATTHGQYYQLNMEDPDVVVWYTLDGGWYGNSPNDVSNNYYIYNKGNITYSGVGHRASMTNFEKDLFINTIIASLRAGIEGPQVYITNATYNNSDECYYMQADIDEDSTDSEYVGKEDVQFYVTDDSSSSDTMYVCLNDLVKDTSKDKYNEDADKTTSYEVYDESGNKVSTTTFNGKTMLAIKRSTDLTTHTYTLKYPRANFKGTDEDHRVTSQAFRITAYNSEKSKGFADSVMSRRSVFNLD